MAALLARLRAQPVVQAADMAEPGVGYHEFSQTHTGEGRLPHHGHPGHDLWPGPATMWRRGAVENGLCPARAPRRDTTAFSWTVMTVMEAA